MLSLLKAEWRLLGFGFLMTFWSAPGQTFLISLFSGEIRADLQLSDGEFASIYSLATLTSAGVMIWSGSLLDRINLKTFSVTIICLLAVGCGSLSIAEGSITLFISIFLIRQFGQGLMTMTSSATVVRYIKLHRGKSSALAGMGYAIAEATMPIILVAVLALYGWRHSWQIIAITLCVFMIPAVFIFLKNHQQRHDSYLKQFDQKSSSDSIVEKQWSRREVIRDKWFYLFMPGLMSQPLMFTGFIFHQVHLVDEKNWSLTHWAALFSIYALVSVVTKLGTGFLVDRFGAISLVFLVAIPMGFGLIVLALSESMTGAAIFFILTGITVGFFSTVSAPFWAEMYGTKHLASIKSLGTAVMVFSTAVSPILLGWQIDLGTSMDTLAIIAAMFMFASSALAYYASRNRSLTQ